MLSPQYFYHSTIRNMVVLFGTLFNDMSIRKPDGTMVKIPLTYSSKQKWYATLSERMNHGIKDGAVQRPEGIIFPRMAYLLTSMSYDATRHCSSRNMLISEKFPDPSSRSQVLQPVPYNLSFDLYIVSRTTEDGLQIIEQILPFFSPRFSVSFNELPDIDILRDIEISLDSVSMDSDYLGEIQDFTKYEWTLGFTVEANFFPDVRSKKVIREVITGIGTGMQEGMQSVTTQKVIPEDASLADVWELEKNSVVVRYN